MRLKGSPRHVAGWIHGLIEGSEPDAARQAYQLPRGPVEELVNFFVTKTGRLAVRGGSQVAQSLHSDTGADLTRLTGVWAYTQTGAIAAGWGPGAAGNRNYLYRLTPDLGWFNTTEAASRTDLAWNRDPTIPARPVAAELFETLYLADAQLGFGSRNPVTAVDLAGTVTVPAPALDGSTAGPIYAYCAEVYNGVLFVAGYDSVTGGEEPAMLRHSLLATSPTLDAGWDKDAYDIIGARGVRITALRAAKTVLLIAKANELYRLTGSGRALPGWQYVVQPVENTVGAGVIAPAALEYADGYWYGIGESGPWRSDGNTVESLLPARRISWRKVTNIRNAFVSYDPTRRVVKFGFNMTPVDAGRSPTEPWVVWNWDIDSETWTGDEKYPADLAMVRAIPSLTSSAAVTGTGATGPAAAPTTPAWTTTTPTAVAFDVSWVNGDATASTEVWVRTDAGGYTLYGTAAPGATTLNVASRDGGAKYWAKMRHIKSGIWSGFTDEVDCYTKPAIPGVGFPIAPDPAGPTTTLDVNVTVSNAGRITLNRNGVDIATMDVSGSGTYQFVDTFLSPATTYTYKAKVSILTFPADATDSPYSGTQIGTTAS